MSVQLHMMMINLRHSLHKPLKSTSDIGHDMVNYSSLLILNHAQDPGL